MTEESPGASLPTARVATRPGASSLAEHRRRIYQRHLLVFLAVNVGLVAADLLTAPGLQWAHFLAFPWLLLFLVHTAGLKSRGHSFAELLIPPRDAPVRDVYTVPLDYELVRARQLRDGVVTAAAALRDRNRQLADSAAAAADGLLAATESAIASVRGAKHRGDERAAKLEPHAQAALDALDRLHQDLISVAVSEDPVETVALDSVQERTEDLRKAVG